MVVTARRLKRATPSTYERLSIQDQNNFWAEGAEAEVAS